MKLLRNREIRLQLIVCFCVLIVLAIAACVISGVAAALITTVCGLIIIAVNCFYLGKRYSRLRQISEDIDRILHGQESIISGQDDEGELAVLTSEIQKMTVMLREQTDRLASEKIRLTDAISDMFHQMRTPITSMNIQLSLLAESGIDDSRRFELVREVKKQTEIIELVDTKEKLAALYPFLEKYGDKHFLAVIGPLTALHTKYCEESGKKLGRDPVALMDEPDC